MIKIELFVRYMLRVAADGILKHGFSFPFIMEEILITIILSR